MPPKQFSLNRKASKKPIPIGTRSHQSQATTSPSDAAIISPVVDFLCCGGLSIIAVMAIFAYAFSSAKGKAPSEAPNIVLIGILGTLINAPHFMASYFLLYRKRAQISQHRWASFYVPAIIFAIVVFAFLSRNPQAGSSLFNAAAVDVLSVLSVILLAWHYTGQAWGMTASFAYIRGIRMDELERRLVRCGCYALLVWHILWTCLFLLRDPEALIAKNFSNQVPQVVFVYDVWSVVVLLTIPLGIAGFVRIRRRTGIMPPLRCYAPWIASYLWYTLIWAHPKLFPLLQIFHALQYLVFPIRVEVNQYSAKHKRTETRQLLHGVAYYLVLVIVGLAVFELPAVPSLWGDGKYNFVAVVSAFVNIHHYFIDGAIWKIRNPEVRRDLFAHLKLA